MDHACPNASSLLETCLLPVCLGNRYLSLGWTWKPAWLSVVRIWSQMTWLWVLTPQSPSSMPCFLPPCIIRKPVTVILTMLLKSWAEQTRHKKHLQNVGHIVSARNTLAFIFTFLKMNKQKGINFSCVWWKHSTVKSEKQLCWLVLSQLDTSEGRFGRENLSWENAPTRLVCGQFCNVLSWLVCAEFVSWWAVSSFGQRSWMLWKSVYISQEEQTRKQHSCMASLSVSVSGFMACLSSCFSFSQWWSVTWQCKIK